MLAHLKVSFNESSICLSYQAFFHFCKASTEPSSFRTSQNSFKSVDVAEKVFVAAPQRGSVDLQLAVLAPVQCPGRSGDPPPPPT